MKILHTISVRWWNACAYYAVSMASAMSELGHDIFFASEPASPPFIHAKQLGLNVIPVNFKSMNPYDFLSNSRQLQQLIKEKNIQLINSHRPEDHLITGYVSKKTRIPLVRTVGDIRPPKENPLNKWLHLKVTNHFIYSCEANYYRYFSVWPALENNADIIYGGLDLKRFQPQEKNKVLMQKFNLNGSEFIVGIIGRLSRNKDLPTFIKSAKLVSRDNKNVKFLISGEEFSVKVKDLKQLSADLNIEDQIIFTDRVDDVKEIISLLDVGVIASNDSEAISRIAMEYMSMGKPVVATNVNVLPEIIQNERNGFIVHPEDPHEMAVSVSKILNDTILRERISETNISDAQKRFNILSAANETIDIYEKVIAQRCGGDNAILSMTD